MQLKVVSNISIVLIVMVLLLSSCSSSKALYTQKIQKDNKIIVVSNPVIGKKEGWLSGPLKFILLPRMAYLDFDEKNIKIENKDDLDEWLNLYNKGDEDLRIFNTTSFNEIYLISKEFREKTFSIKKIEDLDFYLKAFRHRKYEKSILNNAIRFIASPSNYKKMTEYLNNDSIPISTRELIRKMLKTK